MFDLYNISPVMWRAIEIGSLLLGVGIGYALHRLFKGAGFNLDSSRPQTFFGGCLMPIILGVLVAVGISQLIPDCSECGFTPDAEFVPLVMFPFIAIASFVVFFAMAWRR